MNTEENHVCAEHPPPLDRVSNGLSETSVLRERLLPDLLALALLAVAAYAAIFLYSSLFGFYEDDYLLTINFFGLSWNTFTEYLKWCFFSAPQGRPIGWTFNALLAYLFQDKDSLELSYLGGWIVLTTNAFLVYKLVRKLLAHPRAAIVSGLFLLLLPFDLSKAILMHRAFVYLSMTFLLIGLNMWFSTVKVVKWLSYPVCFLCLLTWEGFFLPFLFAPLLQFNRNRKWIINAGIHVLCWVVLLSLSLVARYLAGEDRVGAMASGGSSMLVKMIQAALIGPATALSATALRPYEAAFHADWNSFAIGMFVFGLVLSYLWKVNLNEAHGLGRPRVWFLFFVLGAIGATVFPYILMYRPAYFPPNTTVGRLSVVHAPSEVGYCLLVGSVYYFLEARLGRAKPTLWVLFSLFFGLLTAFSVHIQKTEYVEGWLDEREIWRQIGDLAPDAREGTHVIVDLKGVPYAQMFGSYWLSGGATPNFQRFFVFPQDWKVKPDVNALSDWCGYERRSDGLLLKSPSWSSSSWPLLKDGNFILLRMENGELARVVEPTVIFGVKLTPKAKDHAPILQMTPLGRKLLDSRSSRDWPILRNELPYPKEK
jgi:hypothetical protein